MVSRFVNFRKNLDHFSYLWNGRCLSIMQLILGDPSLLVFYLFFLLFRIVWIYSSQGHILCTLLPVYHRHKVHRLLIFCFSKIWLLIWVFLCLQERYLVRHNNILMLSDKTWRIFKFNWISNFRANLKKCLEVFF